MISEIQNNNLSNLRIKKTILRKYMAVNYMIHDNLLGSLKSILNKSAKRKNN